MVSVMTLNLFAQKDVTTFLGIPVDGFKSEMKQKLIAKGFVPKKSNNTEYFEGEFNGKDVHIHIVTNNNKVYRLYLADVNTQNGADIINRFNTLIYQFQNNKRYITKDDITTIPQDENILYEMSVNNKIYEANFYQKPKPETVDSLNIQKEVEKKILEHYTQEELQNPTDKVIEDVTYLYLAEVASRLYSKSVWFRIFKTNYDEYYIGMYYDNEYNKPNGEDL